MSVLLTRIVVSVAFLFVLAITVVPVRSEPLDPTHAGAQTDWRRTKQAIDACHQMKRDYIRAVGEYRRNLWFASTDNSRHGWINPSVTIAGLQWIQREIALTERKINTMRRPVSVRYCSDVLESSYRKIRSAVWRILNNGNITGN